MTTVCVPSRTKAGQFYEVTIGLDGTPICRCPASFYPHRGTCWHVRYVQEEMMNETTTALVPIQLAERNALVPSEREMIGITRAAKLALSGAVALPPELNTPEKVATVMLYGLELGLMPFTAVRHLYIVKGRVSPSAEVMAGMYMRAEPGGRLIVDSIDDNQCTMRIIRPSRGINETYQVTWAEIKTAGLASGANLQYPRDRMRAHSTKRLLRIYAPDIINMLNGPSIDLATVDTETGEVLDDLPLTNEGDTWREETPVQAPPAPPRPTPGPRTPGVNDQQAAWEQEPVVQAARVERDAAMAQAIAKNEQATGPIALLNAIGEQQGLGAKQAAIKVMTRLFGTAAVTKLDDDQRAEYTDILAFRLAGTTHEHEEAFTANGVLICRLCGDALEGDIEVPAQQPSIAVS